MVISHNSYFSIVNEDFYGKLNKSKILLQSLVGFRIQYNPPPPNLSCTLLQDPWSFFSSFRMYPSFQHFLRYPAFSYYIFSLYQCLCFHIVPYSPVYFLPHQPVNCLDDLKQKLNKNNIH